MESGAQGLLYLGGNLGICFFREIQNDLVSPDRNSHMRLLSVLLSSEIAESEKKRILRDDYAIRNLQHGHGFLNSEACAIH